MKLHALALSIFFTCQVFGSVTVGTYNIRNFDYDDRSQTATNKEQLVRIILKMKTDLLAVQEINDTYTFASMIKRNLGDQYQAMLTECGGTHDQRLGFVINTEKFKVLDFAEDLRTTLVHRQQQSSCHRGSRPLAIIKLQHRQSKKKLAAISVHLKSGNRGNSIQKRYLQIKEIQKVKKELNQAGYKNIIVMGDFNTTEYYHTTQYRRKFQDHIDQMGMLNATGNLACTSYWWGNQDDGKQYPSHLDHILISSGISSKTAPKVYGHCQKLSCRAAAESRMDVSFDEVSDHCPIAREISL